VSTDAFIDGRFVAAAPFGGFNGSGQGRDRSPHALESYTQLNTTWIAL